jgi:hypothetical protein
MSDFKFFCPECSQKIVCEDSYAGVPVTCPTCGKSVVPPASKSKPEAEKQARPTDAAPAANVKEGGKLQRMLAVVYPCLALAGFLAAVWWGAGSIPKVVLVWAIIAFVPMFFICLGEAGSRLVKIVLRTGCVGLGLLLLFIGTSTLAKWYSAPKIVVRESPAELASLQPRIVDEVFTGVRASEQEHNLTGKNLLAGPFNGKFWRSAVASGSVEYVMKVLPDQAMSLNCRYWGSEAAGRTFDICIDGTVIATQNLEFNVPGHFFDAEYKIPRNLTRGKSKVSVKFQAHPGLAAGGLFGCQMLKR